MLPLYVGKYAWTLALLYVPAKEIGSPFAYMYLSVLIPYKFAPAELLIAIPPVSKRSAEAFVPVLPVTVQIPVNVPLVTADPVVISVAVNAPVTVAVVAVKFAIDALAEIVK